MTVRRRTRGFSLTEIMIAVAVLIAILLAVSKIFSTTSKVTGVGQATADIMQDVATIGRQLRDDLSKLSPDGFLAIRCVAVPNDIVQAIPGGGLLNPSLPSSAIIRADQLVFFTDGAESVQTFRVGDSTTHRGGGTLSRVYFGHAFSLGDAGREVTYAGTTPQAKDPYQILVPWSLGPVSMANTDFAGGSIYGFSGTFQAQMLLTDARKWLLARQNVILVDDGDGDDTSYLIEYDRFGNEFGGVTTARSIFLFDPFLNENTLQIYHGRMDAASMGINGVRQRILFEPTGAPRPWRQLAGTDDQFSLISDQLVYYPRAERRSPSMDRVDQALTTHVLGTAVSSIKIDWTYRPRTGETVDGAGVFLPSVLIDPSEEQPWFGFPDPERGVFPYEDEINWTMAQTIFPENVERPGTVGQFPFNAPTYEAFFGFNRDVLLDGAGFPDQTLGYTPWPSAIRVTLTVHDPTTKLEQGREVQFVIDLPRRSQ